MQEHDTIVSTRQIESVPKNTPGTIVFVYDEGVYEVEFSLNGTSEVVIAFEEEITRVIAE